MTQYAFPMEDTDYLAEQAQAWFGARGSGVYSADEDLTVAAVGGMQIAVGAGMAWMHWARFSGIVYVNTDTVTLDIDQADGILDRIDRVVARYDIIGNTVTLAIKKGVPASAPVAPALQRDAQAYEIALADIHVNRGITELSQVNIYDQRLNEDVCGVMRDGVTGIPTAQLQAQWEAWLAKIADIPMDETVSDWLVAHVMQIEQTLPNVPGSVPRGGIIMWGGAIVDIPAGWALCDGTNNTPDLRDKFIVGAGGEYQAGDKGGENSVILIPSQLPSHQHGSAGLTIAGAGDHRHILYGFNGGAAGSYTVANPSGYNFNQQNMNTRNELPLVLSSSGAHIHTISGNTAAAGNDLAHENRPPYYALAYIMRLYE